MKREDSREKILDIAAEMLYRCGIHATGVDSIVARADVARMTFYKYFPSKDALIEAVLQRQFSATHDSLTWIVQQEKTPDERLTLLFDTLDHAVQTAGFFGCPFINAVAEYSDPTHPFHRIAIAYKQMYRECLREIVAQIPGVDAIALAAQLFLLIEGALVVAQVDSRQRPAQDALAAARILVEAHHFNRTILKGGQ